ncbi:MAG: hypothetical protein GY750_10200 [Lentisphaerae bacterium]|nr:hypothetical protein [Lentisphaerota bacterium]MCP4101781.1 hypothetical protein [Lentisphaerota bacterium]
MLRALKLTKHFGINAGVVINKYDINLKETETIKEKCKVLNVPVIGEVPFDEDVGVAITNSCNLIESAHCPVRDAVIEISNKIQEVFEI